MERDPDQVTGSLVEALWQFWRRWRQTCHPVRKGKITPEQFWLMKRLKRAGRLTVGELAGGLGITSSSASTAVKRLEKIGMVQRDRQKQDERVVTVELTADAWRCCSAGRRSSGPPCGGIAARLPPEHGHAARRICLGSAAGRHRPSR